MMKEELATHEVEGEVVGCPGKEEEARAVVEARASSCHVTSAICITASVRE